jgi:uncharacterized membrane protein YbaN (DUF454 family)
LIITGMLSLTLGGIGVVLPLLPTTPFVLVAAIAFANSSERLHNWLLEHRIFGPLIADWRRYGAISRRTKTVSLLSMVALVLISLLLSVPTHVIVIQALFLTASAAFIITRPDSPDS